MFEGDESELVETEPERPRFMVRKHFPDSAVPLRPKRFERGSRGVLPPDAAQAGPPRDAGRIAVHGGDSMNHVELGNVVALDPNERQIAESSHPDCARVSGEKYEQ